MYPWLRADELSAESLLLKHFRTIPAVSGGNLAIPTASTLSCWLGNLVTIDEELNLLDQQLRRLKIEYEIFFNNPSQAASRPTSSGRFSR